MTRQKLLAEVLATVPPETCPSCGDPSAGGKKCRACKEYDGDPLPFFMEVSDAQSSQG